MSATASYSKDEIDSIAMASAKFANNRYHHQMKISSSSATSGEGIPSASEKLVEGLDEALALISGILQSSAEVMDKFRAEWDVALSSYQLDIGLIEEEYERIMKEQKRRKKIMSNHGKSKNSNGPNFVSSDSMSSGKEADHALNFHLASKKSGTDYGNDGFDNMFILPTDEDELEIECLSDDENNEPGEKDPSRSSGVKTRNTKQPRHSSRPSQRTNSNSSNASSTGKKINRKQPTSTRKSIIGTKEKNEERDRFDSRSILITKMQRFREEEASLLQQLEDAQPKDNGMTTTLSIRERQDLEDSLERCRARQTEEVVAIVTNYKPRFKVPMVPTTKGSMQNTNGSKSGGFIGEDLGLNLPNIENIMEEAMMDNSIHQSDGESWTPSLQGWFEDDDTVRSPDRGETGETSATSDGTGKRAQQLSINRVGKMPIQSQRNLHQKSNRQSKSAKKGSSKNQSSKLTLNFTNLSETEQHVLKDPENFLSVHELSIETPTTKTTTTTTMPTTMKADTKTCKSCRKENDEDGGGGGNGSGDSGDSYDDDFEDDDYYSDDDQFEEFDEEDETDEANEPEPVHKTVSELVMRHTRPLNSLELGRRNRVGDRHHSVT